MLKRARLLTHPSFILALAILLLNDHFLKSTFPCWLTGKLSDFAGLYVFAVFNYVVFGNMLKSRRTLFIMHFLIMLAFIIWKIAPVEIVFSKIQSTVNIPLPGRVKDISDLIALPILGLSYYFIVTCRVRSTLSEQLHFWKKAILIGLSGIAFFSIVATSKLFTHDIKPNIEFKANHAPAEILYQLEDHLKSHNIEIISQICDSNTYTISTKTDFCPASVEGYQFEGTFWFHFYFHQNNLSGKLVMDSISTSAINRDPADVEPWLINDVINPFMSTVE